MLAYLDPGHFANTGGKRSPDSSLLEYEFNQTVANKAMNMLIALGIPTKVTKEMEHVGNDDESLGRRCQKANEANADIFISIHGNAHKNEWTSARGWEVYHYPGSITGAKLAELAVKNGYSKVKSFGVPNRGIKTANFAVIRETKMPAILIEWGFFTNREECELMKGEAFRDACAKGIVDIVLDFFGIRDAKPISSNGWNIPLNTTIFGESLLSAKQLDTYAKKVNPTAPELADYFINIGKLYGIRGDIAFCQAIHETSFFRYGGIIRADQNNYGGLGATDGSRSGARFATPRQGVLAMIQHLYAYACNLPLPNNGEALVDGRFNLVNRGSAPYFEQLAGKWAIPGYNTKYSSMEEAYKNNATYGQDILKHYQAAAKIIASNDNPREDSSDGVNNPKFTSSEQVLHTITRFGNVIIPTIVINGNSFFDVSDVAALLNCTVIWDKLKQEVILAEKK